MRRHKAAAINEPGIRSQLICWYVLYYRASLDLTSATPRASVHAIGPTFRVLFDSSRFPACNQVEGTNEHHNELYNPKILQKDL